MVLEIDFAGTPTDFVCNGHPIPGLPVDELVERDLDDPCPPPTIRRRVSHAFCHDITAARDAGRFGDVEAVVSRKLVETESSAAGSEGPRG